MPSPLFCRTEGDPSHPPLLLLHGFLGSGDDWQDLLPSLTPRFFCLAPDLPGHGRTTISDERCFTMEGTATLLLDLLARFGQQPARLIGYSMGGRIALHLAVRHPERFSQVILESASPGLASESERADRREHDARLARRLESEPFESFLRDWYAQPLFSTLTRHPTRLAHLLAARSTQNPPLLARSLQGLGTGMQEPLWNELHHTPSPLLIVGDEDAKFKAIAARMASRMPTAKTEIVAGAGHNVHLEQPDRYLEIVTNFLTD